MQVRIHGLEGRQGETAFAFLVLRLVHPVDRVELVTVIRHVASIIPDAEAFIAELPETFEEAMQIVGMPWIPAEAGHAVEARRWIESARCRGVEVSRRGSSRPARACGPTTTRTTRTTRTTMAAVTTMTRTRTRTRTKTKMTEPQLTRIAAGVARSREARS